MNGTIKPAVAPEQRGNPANPGESTPSLTQDQLVALLKRAFILEDLPPYWGPAIAMQESGLHPNAINHGPGDEARGGSYGLCMMSFQTAVQDLGFKGEKPELLDPKTNATLAARYCKLLTRRFKTESLLDIAAAYNSGKLFNEAPLLTRSEYVPQVLSYALQFKA